MTLRHVVIAGALVAAGFVAGRAGDSSDAPVRTRTVIEHPAPGGQLDLCDVDPYACDGPPLGRP
jgi:hypothetical protein